MELRGRLDPEVERVSSKPVRTKGDIGFGISVWFSGDVEI